MSEEEIKEEILEEEEEETAAAPEDELKEQLEELKKERDGFYREMINERRTRQELKSQLENINEVLTEIKSKKQAGGEAEKTMDIQGIPVKFDDDGDPYIDPADIQNAVKPVVGDIKKQVDTVRDTAFEQNMVNANANIVNKVINEDPSYATAYQAVQQAWNFLDAEFDKIVRQRGLDPKSLDLDTASELLNEAGINDVLAEKMPGLDVDTVLDAFETNAGGVISSRKLRKAVKRAAKAPSGGKTKLDNLKRLAENPRNLAGKKNRKGASGRTLEDIADISAEEFLNLSDVDIKRLERALGRSES